MVDPVILVIIAFAAYRLAAVLTGTDSLLEVTHRRILGWAYEQDDCGGVLLDDCGDQIRRRGVGLLRTKIVDLVSCPFCLGMWIAAGMLCAWFSTWPWALGWRGWITAVGIAGVQAFLTAVDGR